MKRTHPTLKKTGTALRSLSRELTTVSQLAAAANEPAHAVRYYCRIGLLIPSHKSKSGYRLFDRTSLVRLRFIRRAQGFGFTLQEIAGFMCDAAAGNDPCREVMATLDRRLPQIGEELAALVELHTRMTRARDRWRTLGEGIPTGYEICRLIESEEVTPNRSGSTPALQPEISTESSS